MSSRSQPPMEPKRDPSASISGISEASHPPSEPRPLPHRPGADAGPETTFGRFQVIFVLLLLLVLVTIPLYLWRRPIAAPPEETNQVTTLDASTAVELTAPIAATIPDSGVVLPANLTLGEPHVLECHDSGSKKTLPQDCDRLPAFEHALAQAIADNATCAEGGSITFAADVSFARKKQPILLSLPHEGRSVKNAKMVGSCAADVKKSLAAITLGDASHQHGRYKIEIVATYASKP